MTTTTTVATAHYEPLVRSFIRFWQRAHTHPMRGRHFAGLANPPLWSEAPKAVDIIDWMVRTGLTHDEARAVLTELADRGRLQMYPDGRPAFKDEPLYHWVQVAS